MDNNIFCAFDRFKGLFYQMLAALHKHLNGHVVGNIIPFNQRAQDFIFGFGSRRETDFDFFNPDVHKRFEHFELFFQIHRVDQRLVAVAQVNRTPNRRFFNRFRRPGAVGNINRFKRNVLLGFHLKTLLLFFYNKKSPEFYRLGKIGARNFSTRYHPNSAAKRRP